MATRSLENLISRKALTVSFSNLKLAIQSPLSESIVWVLVEGVDDEMFYEKMFAEDKVKIRTAELVDKNKDTRGRDFVQKMVSRMRTDEGVRNIIGIVDKDYWHYTSFQDILDAHVFKTDYRDLEMTLVADAETVAVFSAECPMFSANMAGCIEMCTYMGQVRITALSLSGNAQLKKWKLSFLWDIRNKAPKPDWKETLVQMMNDRLSRKILPCISSNEVVETVAAKKLLSENPSDVCRGHDFMDLMQYMINNAGIWNKKTLFVHLCECYPEHHFLSLTLWKLIHKWQTSEGFSILK